MSPRNHHLALGAYLSVYAGVPYLPLNPDRGSALYALGQGSVEQILCAPQDADRIPALRLRRPVSWLEYPDGPETARPAALPARAVQLIVGTSGTGGAPQWAMLTNGNLTAAVSASRQRIPLGPEDRWLTPLPLHHVGGLMVVFRCLEARAMAVVQDHFSPGETREYLQGHGITHISLVPAMLAALLESFGHTRAPDSLRVALIGGGPLPRTLARRALSAGWPLYATYGMTETGSQVATRALDTHWETSDMGPPLPGFEVGIHREKGTADGTVGLVYVSGPAVMAGYLRRDGRLGAGLDPDHGFTTGDLGHVDANGHLHVLGRADELIVTGGENVHHGVVERRIQDCPGVRGIAILGQADEIWGQRLVALFVGDITPAELDGWCHRHLPAPWRPRRTLRVDRLPRNALGKLRRDRLTGLIP